MSINGPEISSVQLEEIIKWNGKRYVSDLFQLRVITRREEEIECLEIKLIVLWMTKYRLNFDFAVWIPVCAPSPKNEDGSH